MKLRIKGNSIRLRVLQHELDDIQRGLPVIDELRFPGTEMVLRYSLRSQAQPEIVAVFFDGSDIRVCISAMTSARWARPDEVGIYADIPLEDGLLSVAIEKDFACLDRREEDDAGTFANPLVKEKVC